MSRSGPFHHLSANEQQRRLEAEGIVFTNDKISLGEYQWREPEHDDEPTQGSLFG